MKVSELQRLIAAEGDRSTATGGTASPWDVAPEAIGPRAFEFQPALGPYFLAGIPDDDGDVLRADLRTYCIDMLRGLRAIAGALETFESPARSGSLQQARSGLGQLVKATENLRDRLE